MDKKFNADETIWLSAPPIILFPLWSGKLSFVRPIPILRLWKSMKKKTQIRVTTITTMMMEDDGSTTYWHCLVNTAVVDVINFSWRKSRFSLKLKQQEYAILKAISSFRVQICWKIAVFSHFCAGSESEQTFSKFFILGKSWFHPKKFYNINYRLDNPVERLNRKKLTLTYFFTCRESATKIFTKISFLGSPAWMQLAEIL